MTMLECPRCGQLCDPDCKYCAECGCRLLPNERELELLREMTANWAQQPIEEDGWPLAAAHIRLAYGAGYSEGLQERVDAEPADEVQEAGADR